MSDTKMTLEQEVVELRKKIEKSKSYGLRSRVRQQLILEKAKQKGITVTEVEVDNELKKRGQ